jgi:hypothetical protein
MAKFKRLLDFYRFPGFVAFPLIHGVFGDPVAAVISYKRRRKKQFAVAVARCFGLTMTSALDESAICRVATSASISLSSYGECIARGVGL